MEKLNDDLKLREAEFSRNLAEKVSHDIRSPIAAAQSVLDRMPESSTKELAILKIALQRIDRIANDLLHKEGSLVLTNDKNELISLKLFLENIINEKKVEYSIRTKVDLELQVLKDVDVIADEVGLGRVLSNLINNSYEAITNKGKISLILDEQGGEGVIKVVDTGRGIPKNILKNIGKKKASFGKEGTRSGSGIGLLNARKDLETNGGRLEIYSEEGLGTSVELYLPSVKKLKNNSFDIVFIDDDELMRAVWEGVAVKKGISLLVLASVDDFILNEEFIKIDSHIYIDSELGEGSIKGEHFAEQLHLKGYRNLYITSGHPAERFIQFPWLKWVNKKCPL